MQTALAELNRIGRVRLDDRGSVIATLGLSIEPTRHEIRFEGKRRWTWCAYDALGILAALEIDGQIQSTTPFDEPIQLRLVRGQTTESTAVLFFPDSSSCSSVVEEWCPLANFFLDADAAWRWASDRGVEGRVLTLDEGSELGVEYWAQCFVAAET